MTISYAGNFARLLFRWKGSIWKSIWLELLLFLTTYYSIRMIKTFDYLAVLFNDYTKQIPLTFLLGFYVALIVKRWWEQFECVAWPDDLLRLATTTAKHLAYTCAVFHGEDERSCLKRHTIARYANLTAALAWREISVKVRCRFPLIESFVSAGLMTEDEMELYLTSPSTQMDDSVGKNHVGSIRWQLPLTWIQRMLEEQMNNAEISPPLYSAYLVCLYEYRTKFQELFKYDWVCVPLVYTQVAALATYGYFGFCLIGRQFLNPLHNVELYEVDFYLPIFTILQFLFFVGWFKVGQDLMRPFGEDDDDIELNYILDRNVAVSFALVHHAARDVPPACNGTQKDKLYDACMRGESIVLPHTRISAKIREHPPKMHAFVDVSNPRDVELTSALVHPQVDMFVEKLAKPISPTTLERLTSALRSNSFEGMLDPQLSAATTGSVDSPHPARSNKTGGSLRKTDSLLRRVVAAASAGSASIERTSSTSSDVANLTAASLSAKRTSATITTGGQASASTPAMLRCQVNLGLQRGPSMKSAAAATTVPGGGPSPTPSVRRTDSVMAKPPSTPGVVVVANKLNDPEIRSSAKLSQSQRLVKR